MTDPQAGKHRIIPARPSAEILEGLVALLAKPFTVRIFPGVGPRHQDELLA